MNSISDQYLDALGADTNLLTKELKGNIDNKGFVVIPYLIDALWIGELQIRFNEIIEEEGKNTAREHHKETGAPRLANHKGTVWEKVWRPPAASFCPPIHFQWRFQS